MRADELRVERFGVEKLRVKQLGVEKLKVEQAVSRIVEGREV